MTTEKINETAKWFIETAARNTGSGNYILSYKDIADSLDEDRTEVLNSMEQIADAIYKIGGDDVLEVDIYKEHNETVIDVILGADIVCKHCKGICNRSYEECGDCDVMMGLWED